MKAHAPAAGEPVGLGALHCLLPEERVAVDELPELASLGRDELEFAKTCGVRSVAAFPDTTAGELAAEACRQLLARRGQQPDVVLLVAARAPEVLLGSDACRLQDDAGLDASAAFTIDGLGCAGSSAAWGLARDMLSAGSARRAVLVAHASRPTALERVRYPVTIIGDGACAMTLERGGRPVLRAHRLETDGRFADLFRVNYRETPWYEWREECASPDRYRFELAMHSRLRLSRLVEQVLADAGASKADVRATVMQNVTAGAFDFYESLLGLPIHPVCREQLALNGHLGAMDVVLNLERLLDTQTLARGDLVLVLNNSPVAAWAVSLWES